MLRISRYDTGEFFVLGESTFTLDRYSNLFSKEDEFLGDRGQSGDALLEPNRAVIKNAQFVNSSNRLRKLQVISWLDAEPQSVATMLFTVEDERLVYQLYMNSSNVAKDLREKKLYQLVGEGVDGQINFSTIAEFKAYMLSTTVAEPATMPMVYFPYKNDGAYDEAAYAEDGDVSDINYPVNQYINAWKVVPETGIGNFILDPAGGPDRQTQTPFFYQVYVVRRVLQYLGYELGGSWQHDENAKRTVIFSNITSVSVTNIPDYTYFMPDISIGDLIKTLRTEDALLISFNEGTRVCTIDTLQYLKRNAKVIDLRGKQLAHSFRETGTAANAYAITRAVEDKDKAYAEAELGDLPIITVGDITGLNVEPVELATVATRMITEVSPDDALSTTWRVANIKMPVYPRTPLDQVSSVATADMHSFKLRRLYWHGMQPAENGNDYPYGSADNLDFNGDKLTDFTLSLQVTGSTFNALLELYTYKADSKPFELSFLLNKTDLLGIEPNSMILAMDPWDLSSVYCLWDQISADQGNQQLYFVKIVLWPDIQPDNVLQYIPEIPEPEPEPPYDNGVVFVKLILRNWTNVNHPFPPPAYQTIDHDVVVLFYEDAGATIPKDVIGLGVILRTVYSRPPSYTTNSTYTFPCTSTGHEKILLTQAPQSSTQGGILQSWTYEVMPHTSYTIIP
jgi:hypothetical protein